MQDIKTYPKPEEILPHDKPMSLVDTIIHFEEDERIITATSFHKDAFFYKGHFEGNPITPGVILLEAMFQTCGLFLRLTSEISTDLPPIMGRAIKVKNASFSKEVKPNEQLEITAEFKHTMMNFFVFDAFIKKEGKIVCKSELILS